MGNSCCPDQQVDKFTELQTSIALQEQAIKERMDKDREQLALLNQRRVDLLQNKRDLEQDELRQKQAQALITQHDKLLQKQGSIEHHIQEECKEAMQTQKEQSEGCVVS
mmetsp:Transcript_512/g.1298  ORF Transcript_512/g.1298 Transcript_512/m.1298 type:complete len:109 (-) Transcript_512:255-581(-)